MITRFFEAHFDSLIEPNKALVIYGPRRVGKTTLLQKYLSQTSFRYRLESGDNIQVQEVLGSQDFSRLKEFVTDLDLLAIDEAQNIPGIGSGIKILVDHVPGIRIIATGSSSFELAGQVGEPLVGRKRTITLYPISQMELAKIHSPYELFSSLGRSLVFGSYPEVWLAESNEKRTQILNDIINSYLLKDILALEQVKGAKILFDLLRLIAFQVGSEVSLSEIGTKLSIDYKTVRRYLDLFEASFILYNLRGLSRNLRNEVTKKSKYYFYDNGILNAVISNFNPVENREDIGRLWENFMVSERLKTQSYLPIYANNYFWRTWEKKEIDWVEERDGRYFGFEFKYSDTRSKNVTSFLENYSNGSVQVINKENYLPFCLSANPEIKELR